MIGDVLNVKYEIVDQIGQTPIFEVYRAKDRVRGREVIIRILKPPYSNEPEFIERIRQVANRHMGAIGPGMEAYIEVDDDEGRSYIVTEFTSAQSLQQRIDKLAPFSVSVAVSTAISICEGLNAMHQSGMAHGDVSAYNIASMPDGQCRLQLPGLWEAYGGSQTAGVVVLPRMAPYLAPEVSSGSMPSPSSDVYSVGILLYQLLSGRLPYSADTPTAMALKHATAGVPSVKIYNSATPAVLDEIVKKAMAKDPAHRYPNAQEMLSDLRILQDGLRFGKTLNWPLRSSVAVEKQPVAPKMSAIREIEAEERKGRDKEPRDVPAWLVWIFLVCAAVFLALICVWVVFNVSQPKLIVVPNVKGAKLAEARKTLETLGLKIRVSGRETNEVHPPDTILAMDPKAGDKRHEGATINVKISTGSRLVTIPDLRGMTIDKAKAMLEAINLSLSESYSSQPDPTIEAGMIISQSPDAKAKVDRFGRVSVVVSSGKTAGTILDPDNNKQYLYNLTIRLTGLEEGVLLKVDIVDARGERTIYESPHQPEDVVEIPAQGYGKEATFKIYYDNQLVSTRLKKADEEATDNN